MHKTLIDLAAGSGVGVVIGLLFTAWIAPDTPEGMGLIIFVCMVLSATVSRMCSIFMRQRKLHEKPKVDLSAVEHRHRQGTHDSKHSATDESSRQTERDHEI